jgi:hypothetical protein
LGDANYAFLFHLSDFYGQKYGGGVNEVFSTMSGVLISRWRKVVSLRLHRMIFLDDAAELCPPSRTIFILSVA